MRMQIHAGSSEALEIVIEQIFHSIKKNDFKSCW